MTNTDCIFCKIIEGKISTDFMYEDEKTIVLLDIQPSSPGHMMVIPKKHGASILDYEEKELGAVMMVVKKMAHAIEKALQSDSITIGINHLEKEGVHHLHIHLIPRWDNDNGNAIQKVVHNPPKENLGTISQKIKKGLQE